MRVPAAVLALALPVSLLAATGPAAGAAPPSTAAAPAVSAAAAATAAQAERRGPRKVATARGRGGAVASVDPYATRIGLRVLRNGGNAVDAAVATAAALGVTEPYSAGIGGGGYFVYYDARSRTVRTLDGRETAPARMRTDSFVDPATGETYPFTPDLVSSGVAVGVPGTPATWREALRRWGTRDLGQSLRPAARLARRGFVVDQTFHDQTQDNAERFAAFRPTARLFLPGGKAPAVGSTFRNPALARTYELLARKGLRPFYRGAIAGEIVRTVRKPPKKAGADLPAPPGRMTKRDLRRYRVVAQKATKTRYRGLDVHGMAPSSSGGTTVGEALNILERYRLGRMSRTDALHHYLEASALAFADRARYVGDPAYVKVPVRRLLDDTYAAERACGLDPARAATKPVAAGDVRDYDGRCGTDAARGQAAEDNENISTTNLTVADRWGNVVEYTLTIEQTGGSGIVVPGRGFLLNNELTDFSLEYDAADPNRIQPGKRPRSSMSPTIITRKGRPVLALGSPGGSTIITTVLQMIVNRVDLQMSLPRAIAAPRAAQRNTPAVTAEPAFIDRYGTALSALGHTLQPSGDAFTSAAEIGAATAIGFGRRGRLVAVAEPDRRGGGSAGVVRPRR